MTNDWPSSQNTHAHISKTSRSKHQSNDRKDPVMETNCSNDELSVYWNTDYHLTLRETHVTDRQTKVRNAGYLTLGEEHTWQTDKSQKCWCSQHFFCSSRRPIGSIWLRFDTNWCRGLPLSKKNLVFRNKMRGPKFVCLYTVRVWNYAIQRNLPPSGDLYCRRKFILIGRPSVEALRRVYKAKWCPVIPSTTLDSLNSDLQFVRESICCWALSDLPGNGKKIR